MIQSNTKKLVLAAVLAALACVATLVIQIPSPTNGYMNLGDCIVLLSAWILGPFYGAAAAGIGSMLADIISGYAVYAPGTLIIKGLMALVAGLIFSAMKKRMASPFIPRVIGALIAEAIMVVGYFGYAALLMGSGWGALASIPSNCVQGVLGFVSALVLVSVLERGHALKQNQLSI